jgi:hypothetical protein
LVFLWPWFYFAAFVFPSNGRIDAVGNDFGYLYYIFKLYLLDELSHGHFPLWSPSEGAGFPFYANPFVQAFYPFNLPLVVFYKIMGGFHHIDYQAYAVFGICLYALGIYFWLRALGLSVRSALVASLLAPASFKLAEILRFPNAIHTAAWHPWILFAITRLFAAQTRKEMLLRGTALSGFVILLFTAGYPYYAYYSIFLIGPYVLLFWIPSFPIGDRSPRERLMRTALVGEFGIIGALITSPYLIKMQQMLSSTVDRDGKSFAYSTEHKWFWKETFGSLVWPPAACPEGWYYFGIAGLLMVSWFLLTPSRWLGKNLPRFYTTVTFKLLLLGWFATITYITFGEHSALFVFLWNHMPGFSSLRVWGRMNIILLPLIAWLLAVSWEAFAELLARERARGWLQWAIELGTLTLPYAAVHWTQVYLSSNRLYNEYWSMYLGPAHGTEWRYLTTGAYAEASIVGIYLLSRVRQLPLAWTQLVLASGLVMLFVQDVRPLGNFAWWGGVQTYPRARTPLDVAAKNRETFKTARHDGFGTLPLTSSFGVGTIPNWYFGRYVAFRQRTQGEPAQANVLLGVADKRRIFFSSSIDHPTIESFLRDSAAQKATYAVVRYDGDRLSLWVDSPAPAFLSFIDNWDPDWKAWVKGKPVPIQLLFGTFKSIPIPAGKYAVAFVYRPW